MTFIYVLMFTLAQSTIVSLWDGDGVKSTVESPLPIFLELGRGILSVSHTPCDIQDDPYFRCVHESAAGASVRLDYRIVGSECNTTNITGCAYEHSTCTATLCDGAVWVAPSVGTMEVFDFKNYHSAAAVLAIAPRLSVLLALFPLVAGSTTVPDTYLEIDDVEMFIEPPFLMRSGDTLVNITDGDRGGISYSASEGTEFPTVRCDRAVGPNSVRVTVGSVPHTSVCVPISLDVVAPGYCVVDFCGKIINVTQHPRYSLFQTAAQFSAAFMATRSWAWLIAFIPLVSGSVLNDAIEHAGCTELGGLSSSMFVADADGVQEVHATLTQTTGVHCLYDEYTFVSYSVEAVTTRFLTRTSYAITEPHPIAAGRIGWQGWFVDTDQCSGGCPGWCGCWASRVFLDTYIKPVELEGCIEGSYTHFEHCDGYAEDLRCSNACPHMASCDKNSYRSGCKGLHEEASVPLCMSYAACLEAATIAAIYEPVHSATIDTLKVVATYVDLVGGCSCIDHELSVAGGTLYSAECCGSTIRFSFTGRSGAGDGIVLDSRAEGAYLLPTSWQKGGLYDPAGIQGINADMLAANTRTALNEALADRYMFPYNELRSHGENWQESYADAIIDPSFSVVTTAALIPYDGIIAFTADGDDLTITETGRFHASVLAYFPLSEALRVVSEGIVIAAECTIAGDGVLDEVVCVLECSTVGAVQTCADSPAFRCASLGPNIGIVPHNTYNLTSFGVYVDGNCTYFEFITGYNPTSNDTVVDVDVGFDFHGTGNEGRHRPPRGGGGSGQPNLWYVTALIVAVVLALASCATACYNRPSKFEAKVHKPKKFGLGLFACALAIGLAYITVTAIVGGNYRVSHTIVAACMALALVLAFGSVIRSACARRAAHFGVAVQLMQSAEATNVTCGSAGETAYEYLESTPWHYLWLEIQGMSPAMSVLVWGLIIFVSVIVAVTVCCCMRGRSEDKYFESTGGANPVSTGRLKSRYTGCTIGLCIGCGLLFCVLVIGAIDVGSRATGHLCTVETTSILLVIVVCVFFLLATVVCGFFAVRWGMRNFCASDEDDGWVELSSIPDAEVQKAPPRPRRKKRKNKRGASEGANVV